MRRRQFVKVLGGAAVAWPLAAFAQQPERRRRIGVLMGIADDDEAQSRVTSFRDALAKLGWAEGSNLQIEVRWSAGDAEKVRMFAKELVDLRLDAILGQSTPVMVALVRETQTIPIVFLNVADPLFSGFAASLSRPGGNVTGFTTANFRIRRQMGTAIEGNRSAHGARSIVVQPGNSRAARNLHAFNSSCRLVVGSPGE